MSKVNFRFTHVFVRFPTQREKEKQESLASMKQRRGPVTRKKPDKRCRSPFFFFFAAGRPNDPIQSPDRRKKKSDTSQIHIHTRKSSSLTSTSPLSTEPLCFTIFIISLLHVWPSFFLVFLYHISLPLTSPLLTGYGMSYTGSFSRIIICTDDDDLNLPL